jgi:cell division protein FtsB
MNLKNHSLNLRRILFAAYASFCLLLLALPGISVAADADESARLQKLESAVAALQQENKDMKQENKALKQQVAALAGGVGAARSGSHAQAEANSAAPGGVVVDSSLRPLVTDSRPLTNYDFKSPPTDLLENGLVTSPNGKSPLALQIGPVLFTPLGFMDFTSVTRSTRNGGDIGTSFATFPYPNTANAQLSETRFSAKNSRLGLRIDTDIADWKVTGYVETDFLGNQPTNLNVVSNSDTLRMRVYFVDVEHGPWEFLAGQDWSMLTPNRKGISPFPNDIFYSQDVDVNYQLGLVWERTPQLRLLFHPDDHWTLGISAENPDQYVGPAVTLPARFDSTQVDNGSNGTATPNVMPDWIGKVAYDGKIAGMPFHADAAGLLREYKINTFLPVPGTSTDAYATGYGGSINFNIGVLPHLQLIGNFYASNGAGREISTGVAPDFIVTAPDSSGNYHIQTVNSYAGLGGFEWDVFHSTKLYGYYGQTYIDRQFSELPDGTFVGYGFPGSSNSNNKRIQEFTVGLTQILWDSKRYGDIKLLVQYSYLNRDPWSVAPGTPNQANMHMGYFDIRYDLP